MPAARAWGLLLCVASLAASAVGQEWTRLRGPMGQGHGTAELPAVPTAADVRWRKPSGVGHGSPVLWGASLFFLRVRADGGREVVCFDADTGQERWAHVSRLESHEQHPLNTFASSTPAVDADAVYALWTSGKTLVALALDHAGEPLWQRELGAFTSDHGSAMSPIVCGDLVVVANENQGNDCFVTALDRRTGEPRWRIDRTKNGKFACYAPPFVYRPEGAAPVLLLACYRTGLCAIEPDSGAIRWETDLGLKNRFVAVPCLSGDKLLVNAGSMDSGKQCFVFELAGGAKELPEVRYQPRRALPYVPAAIAIDGRFYLWADAGHYSCIEADSGEELWRERIEEHFFSSPVTAGEVIYIGDRDGVLHSYAVGRNEHLGALDLGAPINATPAIAHGRLYVRTETELVCIGPVAR